MHVSNRRRPATEHDRLLCGLDVDGWPICPACAVAKEIEYVPDPIASLGDALGYLEDVRALLTPHGLGIAVVIPGRPRPDEYTLSVVRRHRLAILYAVLDVDGPVSPLPRGAAHVV